MGGGYERNGRQNRKRDGETETGAGVTGWNKGDVLGSGSVRLTFYPRSDGRRHGKRFCHGDNFGGDGQKKEKGADGGRHGGGRAWKSFYGR